MERTNENIDWSLDRSGISVYEPHEGPAGKVKSAYRLRYSAEVEVLKRTYGDIEQIRQSLGLSRRKICQMLMVDPSAWTRWSKSEAAPPPPHIYKTLSLMVQMNDEKRGFVDPVLKDQVKRLELQFAQILDRLERSGKPSRSWWPGIALGLSCLALGLSVYLGFYATSVIMTLNR